MSYFSRQAIGCDLLRTTLSLVVGVGLSLVSMACATTQDTRPTRWSGDFQKSWKIDFPPYVQHDAARTWLQGNLKYFCDPGEVPLSEIKTNFSQYKKDVYNKVTKTSWSETVSEIAFDCPSEQMRQEYVARRVRARLEKLQSDCARERKTCMELARAHVLLKSDVRTVIDEFMRVCPVDLDPADGACLEAGQWATTAALPDVARAFFMRGCIANEGLSCGELAMLDFKTRNKESEKTSAIALEMLREECEARIQKSCSQLSKVVSECPKSNKLCKKASLFLVKKEADDRDAAEQKRQQAKTIDAINRQAGAAEAAAAATDRAAASASAAQLSNSLNQSLNNAYNQMRTNYNTTSCTSQRVGTTTFTNCR